MRAPDRTARAASRPSAAAAEHRCRGAEANATWPRSRSTRARWNSSSGPASAVASRAQSRVERAGLEARLRRGQRAIRAPRRDPPVSATARSQERRRGGEPATSLRPAGRALELRRRPARQGPPRPRPDATPGGPDRPPDRSPPPAPDGPPGAPPPSLTDTPPSAPADGGTSPARRSPAARLPPRLPRPTARSRAARPRASSSSGSPTGSAAASSNRRRASSDSALESSNEALLDPPGQRPARRAARTRPPAASPSTLAATRATPADSPASPR